MDNKRNRRKPFSFNTMDGSRSCFSHGKYFWIFLPALFHSFHDSNKCYPTGGTDKQNSLNYCWEVPSKIINTLSYSNWICNPKACQSARTHWWHCQPVFPTDTITIWKTIIVVIFCFQSHYICQLDCISCMVARNYFSSFSKTWRLAPKE